MRRPGAGHPVRTGIAWRARRQTRKAVHDRHLQQLRQADSILDLPPGAPGNFVVRVNRIVVNAQRTENQAACMDRPQPLSASHFACQQLRNRTMLRARVAANANLHRAEASRLRLVQRNLKRMVCPEGCKNSNAHHSPPDLAGTPCMYTIPYNSGANVQSRQASQGSTKGA